MGWLPLKYNLSIQVPDKERKNQRKNQSINQSINQRIKEWTSWPRISLLPVHGHPRKHTLGFLDSLKFFHDQFLPRVRKGVFMGVLLIFLGVPSLLVRVFMGYITHYLPTATTVPVGVPPDGPISCSFRAPLGVFIGRSAGQGFDNVKLSYPKQAVRRSGGR